MQVRPEVDAALQAQLEAMGFAVNKAIRALHFTGTSSLEQAVAWLVEHGEDDSIDEPLLIPKVRECQGCPAFCCNLFRGLHVSVAGCKLPFTVRCHAGGDQTEAVARGGQESGRGEVAEGKGEASGELHASHCQAT
jgi:hypothetical protein